MIGNLLTLLTVSGAVAMLVLWPEARRQAARVRIRHQDSAWPVRSRDE